MTARSDRPGGLRPRRSRALAGGLLAAALTLVTACTSGTGTAPAADTDEKAAAEYPTRDITFVVPFGPGGGSDEYARQIGSQMAEILGTDLAVRNVPGAASLLGLREAMNAEPDGHTITTFNPPSSPVAQIAAGADAGVDLREATMIGGWGSSSYVVFAHPSVEADNLEDLIALYDSGALSTLGGQGRGGPVELLAELMKSEHEWNWKEYVAYDGGGEVLAAVLRNEVPVAITTDSTIVEQVKAGELKAIAALTQERSNALPDTPTAVEQGFADVSTVGGITRLVAAPPGLPEDIRKALTDALQEAIESDSTRQWAESTGNAVEFMSAEEATAVVQRSFEIEKTIPNLMDILGGN
jgi:tripartite-type tricarboxylate transporter receptor subunit TctC